MFCPTCGCPLKNEDSFCPRCGARTLFAQSAPAVNPAPVAAQAETPDAEADGAEIAAVAAAAAAEAEKSEAGEELSAQENAAPEAHEKPRREVFGFGALLICGGIILALAVTAGIFAGLYFSEHNLNNELMNAAAALIG